MITQSALHYLFLFCILFLSRELESRQRDIFDCALWCGLEETRSVREQRRRTDLSNISESFSFWLWLSSNVDSFMRLSENCSFNQTFHLR